MRRARRRRRGYTLVFFAMFLFGFMALAALVIDLGFARLTQQQMRTATTCAALEALSLTDAEPGDRSVFAGRTEQSDIARRQASAARVAHLFDDDFDPSADAWNFGAGPRVVLSGGIPLNDGFNASQTLSIPDPPVYKPQLQLNELNDPAGDIVAGADTITVRLRRSGEAPVEGVSSNGGPLPFLFGLGSLLPSGRKAAGINLQVESTAEARPVVRVGPKIVASGVTIPGAIPVAVRRDFWESLPADVHAADSQDPEEMAVFALSAPALMIGQTAALAEDIPPADTGYVSIFQDDDRVIGFGWAEIVVNEEQVSVRKLMDPASDRTVASQNATARLSAAWENLQLLTEAERQAVIEANRSFIHPLAAAIARD